MPGQAPAVEAPLGASSISPALKGSILALFNRNTSIMQAICVVKKSSISYIKKVKKRFRILFN